MMARSHRWALVGMVAVLLLASFLYLRTLNAASFWEDESWMAIAIRGDLPGVWTFATENGLHPPLYFYLAWGYSRLAGDGEFALRWLGGLCALIGLALTYRLGADLYDRKTGVYAALLTAGSLFLLYFARNARHYTLFYALAVALAWAYIRWTRRPDSRGRLATVALLQAAILYTHYFGVWMGLALAAHGLFYLKRRDWLRLLMGLAVGGALFLPWVPSIIFQYSGSSSGLGYAVRETDLALSSYLDSIFNANYPLSLALVALGLVATWRARRWRTGVLLITWLVLPTALTLALNTRFQVFVGRNMLFTLGAVSILFGAGLGWIATTRTGRMVATIAALAFVAAGVLQYDAFWLFFTPDWREAARQMAADAHPDDAYVIRAEPYSMNYYLSRYLGQQVMLEPFAEWMANPVTPDRIWLIDGDWAVRFEAIDALAPDVVQTRRVVVVPIVAELYQRPPQQTLTSFGELFALAVELPADGLRAAPGTRLTLNLWWQRLGQAEIDYSAGVYLVAPDGQTAAQQNGGFDQGRANAMTMPRDTWIPDERTLELPGDLPPGEYHVLVGVYDWRDGTRLLAAGGREDGLYRLTTVIIEGS